MLQRVATWLAALKVADQTVVPRMMVVILMSLLVVALLVRQVYLTQLAGLKPTGLLLVVLQQAASHKCSN
jgi:hypothetical protein